MSTNHYIKKKGLYVSKYTEEPDAISIFLDKVRASGREEEVSLEIKCTCTSQKLLYEFTIGKTNYEEIFLIQEEVV